MLPVGRVRRHPKPPAAKPKHSYPRYMNAVAALRADQERSKATLGARPMHDSVGLGPIAQIRHQRAKWRWGHGAPIVETREFRGWWVRREPFEFQVPLNAEPTVQRWSNMHMCVMGPKLTLEDFARGALYEYTVSMGESGPCETREQTAAEGLRDFLKQVMAHLLTFD